MDPRLIAAARTSFAEVFPGTRPRVVFAPGRVNLIGEHTDYNDGFVLPMAISRGIAVAFRPRADRLIRAHSISVAATETFSLDALDVVDRKGWIAYVAGVAWAHPEGGRGLPGLDLCIAADLPIGAGLSSSAAIEVAIARAFADAAGGEWNAVEAARLCQRAENQFVGMQCGVMDQFASAVSKMGCALLLDCRSLHHEPVPIPTGAAVVVMDTGVRRKLATSAYNERRAACAGALAAVQTIDETVLALRDVDRARLAHARPRMTEVEFRRASHVIAENFRPVRMAQALAEGDLGGAGILMNESHASLRDLYEVSCPELDILSELAREDETCFGARMTGAGFGGCAVALVRREHAKAFVKAVTHIYGLHTGLPTWAWICEPEGGASVVG